MGQSEATAPVMEDILTMRALSVVPLYVCSSERDNTSIGKRVS